MCADQLGLGLVGQAIERVVLHFLRDELFGGRLGTAVQAHPQPEQRVGNRVPLLADVDEIDVLEPRQIVLRRPGRALQAKRDLGERQRLLLGEDVEDGFQRAVSARAMEAQLVGVASARA